ncbi:hypothetical protein R6Z07M_010120 [Ovis aries]
MTCVAGGLRGTGSEQRTGCCGDRTLARRGLYSSAPSAGVHLSVSSPDAPGRHGSPLSTPANPPQESPLRADEFCSQSTLPAVCLHIPSRSLAWWAPGPPTLLATLRSCTVLGAVGGRCPQKVDVFKNQSWSSSCTCSAGAVCPHPGASPQRQGGRDPAEDILALLGPTVRGERSGGS